MIYYFKHTLNALVIILLLSVIYTLASCGDTEARYRNAPRKHYSFPIKPPHTKAPPLVQGVVTAGVIGFGLANVTNKEKNKHDSHHSE